MKILTYEQEQRKKKIEKEEILFHEHNRNLMQDALGKKQKK